MITRSSTVPAVLAALILGLLAAGVATVVDRRSDPGPDAEAVVVPVMAELQAFVESARGLPFLEPVDVSVLGAAAFRRKLGGGTSGGPDAESQEGVLRALGLLEAGEDLEEVTVFDPEGVAGFYDTETKELVVRGTRLTPFVRQVLVHELTHALDDQHFDLDRDLPDGEAALAYEALVEGDAILVEARYLESLSPADAARPRPRRTPPSGAGGGATCLGWWSSWPSSPTGTARRSSPPS